MAKRIIYDCDGMLLNYIGGFRLFLKDVFGIETHPEGPRAYDMLEWIGVDDKAFVKDCIRRFNAGEGEYFANLAPVPGAIEAVATLRSLGYEDSILTQCNDDAATQLGRGANLDLHFGGFEKIRYVPLGGSKLPYLQAAPQSWFLEDNIDNAHMGVEAGHDTILLEYLHNGPNGQAEGFSRFSDWGEILRHITERDLAPTL